jgi:hypothetical protein
MIFELLGWLLLIVLFHLSYRLLVIIDNVFISSLYLFVGCIRLVREILL